jgi:hypothetical protein
MVQKPRESVVLEVRNPLPHALVVNGFEVIPDRDRAFLAMRDPAFDPRKKVLLEVTPSPQPAAGGSGGTVKVTPRSTDALELEVELQEPGLLLVTDTYCRDWVARPLTSGPQDEYRVMPANYCLRAVPLAAGRHHLIMEYRPLAVTAGRWVTGVTVVLLTLALIWRLRQHRRAVRGE